MMNNDDKILQSRCFGAVYAALVMLKDRGDTLMGKSCIVFGNREYTRVLKTLLASVDCRVVELMQCDKRDYKVVFMLDSEKMDLAGMQKLLTLQCKCLCEVSSGENNKAILEPQAASLVIQSRICYAPAILSFRLAEIILEVFASKNLEISQTYLSGLLECAMLGVKEENGAGILQACDDLIQRVGSYAKQKREPTNFMLGIEILK